MPTNMRFGMLETKYEGEAWIEKKIEIVVIDNEEVEKERQISHYNPTKCKDDKCGRMVDHEAPCFIDTWSEEGDAYCDSCGKCLRYERKMADRRGELKKP